jgi:penicillin-binding protein 2
MPIDWNDFRTSTAAPPDVSDPRHRMRLVAIVFAVLMAAVFARGVQTEWSEGPEYREQALKPLRRELAVPGVRGRILARDGTVLARDQQVLALAVHYRYLEEPPDQGWLRRHARRRLSRAERGDPERFAAEVERVLVERTQLAGCLADLAGMSTDRWRVRAAQIQARVERIARSVSESLGRETTVAEQLDYHIMADDLPLSLAAQIEGDPERFPGTKIIPHTRRVYPTGALAAQVVGYLGKVGPDEPAADAAAEQRLPPVAVHPDDLVGRAGVEAHYNHLLYGRRGTLVELTDHGGRILAAHRQQEPGVGKDLVLTLDPPLQRTAEELLDAALRRRAVEYPHVRPGGGAAVLMNVHTGALLVAASAPRFAPEAFLGGPDHAVRRMLDDPAGPLVDRVCRMTLAPGSVFKVVTAAALLDESTFRPLESHFCRGYLEHPDAHRCALFVRRGTGHGDVNLADALCVSCNVYFFHHAGGMGAERLVDWAARFGFGRPTGVDLPGEAPGVLPTPANLESIEGRPWRSADTYAIAIGQGSLTATPLQVARMMAAVANGGRLVTPHVLSRVGLTETASDHDDHETADPPHPAAGVRAVAPPRPVAGLDENIVRHLAEGLRRVVADPTGTGHATIHLGSISVAGKTGTAETQPGNPPHSWFAGYLPAENPRYVVVVALEHAGDGATAAGPVVKRLAERTAEALLP